MDNKTKSRYTQKQMAITYGLIFGRLTKLSVINNEIKYEKVCEQASKPFNSVQEKLTFIYDMIMSRMTKLPSMDMKFKIIECDRIIKMMTMLITLMSNKHCVMIMKKNINECNEIMQMMIILREIFIHMKDKHFEKLNNMMTKMMDELKYRTMDKTNEL